MSLYDFSSFSSGGAQLKYALDDGTFLKIDRWGGEAVVEVLTYEVAQACGLDNFLKYWLSPVAPNACLSMDFSMLGYKFVPFTTMVRKVYTCEFKEWVSKNVVNKPAEDRLSAILKVYRKFGFSASEVSGYLKPMFQLDVLFRNTDRHFKNFGVFQRGGRYELAFVFDNGNGLGVMEKWNTKKFTETKLVNGAKDLVKVQPLSKSLSVIESMFGVPRSFNVLHFIQNHDYRITVENQHFRLLLQLLEKYYPVHLGVSTDFLFRSNFGEYRK